MVGICNPLTRCEEKVSLVANTWIKQMHFKKAGDRMVGHKHNFDHQTLLAHGSFRVYVEDKVAEFEAPQVIFVEANKEHMIEALTEGAVGYCIHAVRFGVNVEDIMNPDDIPSDKWFGEETYPLLTGKPSGRYYRTSPNSIP
jgi:hypothetical protein